MRSRTSDNGQRPDFAVEPGPGQESVWDYPRPPTFYIPRADVDLDLLVRIDDQTYCEWKGSASYWALERGPDVPVAWSYEHPRSRVEIIKDLIAFYPGRVDCFLDGEPARTQAGRFYGGRITSEVVGPFKGKPGTGHW